MTITFKEEEIEINLLKMNWMTITFEDDDEEEAEEEEEEEEAEEEEMYVEINLVCNLLFEILTLQMTNNMLDSHLQDLISNLV